jgi:hypothetical protein
MKQCITIFILLAGAIGLSAQSPWTTTTFVAVPLTATGQTSAAVVLQRSAATRDSYSAGKLTVTGVGLTTATFSVLGSADNGATYNVLATEPCSTPGTFATSQTVTASPSCYEVNTSSLFAVKFATSGTFTATSISIVLTVNPNAQITRNGGGGGGGGCTGNCVTSITPGNGISCETDEDGSCTGAVTISTGPTFSITSFTCSTCATVEIGATVASPTNFTAAYSITPSSASISDGTNTDTLTTPFTSGSLAHSYTLTSAGAVTFTLTAVGPTTQTASKAINWEPRVFGGVGTAGATGATASGTSAILVGAAGTLASAGLGNQTSYGPFSPSDQSIYVLMLSGSCTFTSGGFNFPMNTPTSITFINQFGASVSMFLYQSTNLLSAPFTLVPTC